MKVLLVNGSARQEGCTYTALMEVAGALQKHGIETELIQVGTQPIAGCIGCGACIKTGRCFREDGVNEFVEKAKEADGFIFGSPAKLTIKQIEQLVDEVIFDFSNECKIFCINGGFYTLKKLPKPYVAEAKKLIEKSKQAKEEALNA
ncbi:MAG: flavodoxin family protein [Lachnospiraceae bacterium]|nr:flavodoxin family protein [Lachnospiraceae bacterium]